ncbi:hypothetical protein [Kordia sp.]|uniref:hypothetical protein n=1 Tax=Kordia sp. TaxID=1965332 RepID=UPI003B5CBD48
MKRKSKNFFSLNKINISKLNTFNENTIFGGNLPYTGDKRTCDLDTCTSSRFTVDLSGQKPGDGNP